MESIEQQFLDDLYLRDMPAFTAGGSSDAEIATPTNPVVPPICNKIVMSLYIVTVSDGRENREEKEITIKLASKSPDGELIATAKAAPDTIATREPSLC